MTTWIGLSSLNSVRGFQKVSPEVVAGTPEIRLNWQVASEKLDHRPFVVHSASVVQIVSDILW